MSLEELTVSLVEAETEEATVVRLAEVLEAVGARVVLDEAAPGRANLTARLGSPEREGGVLFLGHSDVVPPGPGWTGDPFTVRRSGEAGEELVGRGTTDMKGGLAAVVTAMGAVHGRVPDLPMTLVCTVDEEADAIGVQHYLRTQPPERYSACIVAEPTSLVTVSACRGATNLRVETSGVSAHAGDPTAGANAVLAAADVIAAVEADAQLLASAPHPVLGPATWNVGTIAGGHGTSIVPDRCVLTMDRRTLPDEDPERILRDLLAEARRRVDKSGRPGTERIGIEGRVEMVMPGFETPRSSQLVRAAQDAVRAVGRAGEVGVWSAACEGGFLARHHDVPTIVLGPGDVAGQAHQADERVSTNELREAAEVYALLAMRMGSAPPEEKKR